MHCLGCVFRSKGVAGLYRGLSVKLWQTVLTTALMFGTYEKVRQVIARAMGQHAAARVYSRV
jgi:hypothetical protein